jgi:hypothetical protein
MGYDTDFVGRFDITPPLTAEQTTYLRKFSATRRMRRDPMIARSMPDPERVAVGLPIGDEAAYFTGGDGSFGQDMDPSVRDANNSPTNQPGLWCQWRPSEDGTTLEWDGGEKFYDYIPWLEYIVEHFLRPWDRSLDGQVRWMGEDPDDRGTIFAKGGRIEGVGDKISAGRPSWDR